MTSLKRYLLGDWGLVRGGGLVCVCALLRGLRASLASVGG